MLHKYIAVIAVILLMGYQNQGWSTISISGKISLSNDYQKKAQFIFFSIDGILKNWKRATKKLNIPNPSLIFDSLSRINYEFDRNFSFSEYYISDYNGLILSSPGIVSSIRETLGQILSNH
jgi:hypothetical protein